MKRIAAPSLATIALSAALGLVSCGASDGRRGTPPPDTLQWYFTCGDPVCRGYAPDGSLPLCTSEESGKPCAEEGSRCDPEDECNRVLLCAAEDPTEQTGGCPISLGRFKESISYLSESDLARFHHEAVRLPLATYRLRGSPPGSPRRLGFLIDDHPTGTAVRPDGAHVDLYGYTSLAVAALQLQDRKIEALEAKLDALEREVTRLRHGSDAREGPRP